MATLKDKRKDALEEEFESAVEEAEEDNARTLEGDAEVGEDGCVHGVPLLAGYIDEEGTLHSDFSYREMTGRDEEAINRGDVRQNGAKVINVVCERCVTEVGSLKKSELGTTEWGRVIRSMLGSDLDYMAFKVRELSKGHEVRFSHVCPNCHAKLNTIVDTSEFGIREFKGQSVIDFVLPHKGYIDGRGNAHREGQIRLPNGYDREVVVPMFKKNPTTATATLLARLVTLSDGTPVSQKGIMDMSLRDRQVLEDLLSENTFGLDTSVEAYCESCGQDLSGDVGQSDFF